MALQVTFDLLTTQSGRVGSMSGECQRLMVGGCDFLVLSSWCISFLEVVLGQKRARYPSVSVHPWNDLCHGAASCLESCSAQLGETEVQGSTPEQPQGGEWGAAPQPSPSVESTDPQRG